MCISKRDLPNEYVEDRGKEGGCASDEGLWRAPSLKLDHRIS